MDIVEIFYYDKYNRKISYTCTDKEFNKYIAEFLEEHQNLGIPIKYTYKSYTGEISYYELPRIS